MPFPIDISRPFRYPSELRRLVEAVHGAGEYDESRWIEWKSTLDLLNGTGVRHIAKQILGFANREPAVATAWCQGHAYLVIGIEPGTIHGVMQVDPQILVGKIRPYVGSAITWTPEYVQFNGKDVLVIIVEPPRQGDGIHVLRKQIDNYAAGVVFVRRPGQTEQADPDEMRMLERRLLARSAQVEIGVEPARSSIETSPDFSTRIEIWATHERQRLLGARYTGNKHAQASIGGIAGILGTVGSADRRSEAQYAAEIDAYIKKAKGALARRGAWQLYRYQPSMLSLRLVNHCERNFAQVRVTLNLDSHAVLGFDQKRVDFAEGRKPVMPEAPAPLGTPASSSLAGFPGFGASPKFEAIKILNLNRAWSAINFGDGIQVDFDSFDVRPNETVVMPVVPLIVGARPETVIEVNWTATATNADGQVTGRCAISVSPSTLGDEGWLR